LNFQFQKSELRGISGAISIGVLTAKIYDANTTHERILVSGQILHDDVLWFVSAWCHQRPDGTWRIGAYDQPRGDAMRRALAMARVTGLPAQPTERQRLSLFKQLDWLIANSDMNSIRAYGIHNLSRLLLNPLQEEIMKAKKSKKDQKPDQMQVKEEPVMIQRLSPGALAAVEGAATLPASPEVPALPPVEPPKPGTTCKALCGPGFKRTCGKPTEGERYCSRHNPTVRIKKALVRKATPGTITAALMAAEKGFGADAMSDDQIKKLVEQVFAQN
jgi:hypothetical protein